MRSFDVYFNVSLKKLWNIREVGPWIRMCWCSLLWKIHFCHLSQVHKRYKKISIIMLKENSFHLSCDISCVWSWPLSYFTVYGFFHLMWILSLSYKGCLTIHPLLYLSIITLAFRHEFLCIWEYHHKHISNAKIWFGKNIWNFFEFRIVLAPMCYRSDASLHALTALQTKNVINT